MKYLTFGGKELLAGDEVCDLLIEYGAVLSQHRQADAIDIAAYNSSGDAVTAKLLLGEGTPLMAESARSALPEPDNREAVAYIRRQIAQWSHAPSTDVAFEPRGGIDSAEFSES